MNTILDTMNLFKTYRYHKIFNILSHVHHNLIALLYYMTIDNSLFLKKF